MRGRRLSASERYQEAAVELQLASELNPTDATAESELREVRQRLRTKVAVARGDKTELQALIERSRGLPPPGLELPDGAKLPDSLTFSIRQPAGVPGAGAVRQPERRLRSRLPRRTRHRRPPEHDARDALASLTASTRTFYRVTAPRTITIVPDTPGEAPRVRGTDRPDVLPEQRRPQGSHRPAAHRRRRAADLADDRDQRDLAQGHARAHRRGGAADRRDRQGAAGGGHRRRAARSRSHRLREYGLQIRVSRQRRASPGRSTSTATA